MNFRVFGARNLRAGLEGALCSVLQGGKRGQGVGVQWFFGIAEHVLDSSKLCQIRVEFESKSSQNRVKIESNWSQLESTRVKLESNSRQIRVNFESHFRHVFDTISTRFRHEFVSKVTSPTCAGSEHSFLHGRILCASVLLQRAPASHALSACRSQKRSSCCWAGWVASAVGVGCLGTQGLRFRSTVDT